MSKISLFTILLTVAFFATVQTNRCSPDSGNPIPKQCPTNDPTNTTVHLAHEKDCEKFYKCDHGKRVLFECPKLDEAHRLHFNPSLQVCDWPECVNCAEKKSTKTLVPHPKYCGKYYEIVKGKKHLKKCPRGLQFSPVEETCVSPSQAGCH